MREVVIVGVNSLHFTSPYSHFLLFFIRHGIIVSYCGITLGDNHGVHIYLYLFGCCYVCIYVICVLQYLCPLYIGISFSV